MTTFFNRPPAQTDWQEYQEDRYERDTEARKALQPLADELGLAVAYLHDELITRGIPTEATVIKTTKKYPNHRHSKVTEGGKGWVLSTASNYAGEHAVILMEDGSLRVTGKIDADTGRAEDGGELDLGRFPFHPSFETERGYTETHGYRSEILNGTHPDFPFNEGLYGVELPTQFVAMNLEQLESDVRAVGRHYLGMTP